MVSAPDDPADTLSGRVYDSLYPAVARTDSGRRARPRNAYGRDDDAAAMKRGLAVLADNAAADVKDTDVRVPVASPRTLIRTKDTYRPQDAIDRGFLEELVRRRARAEPETT